MKHPLPPTLSHLRDCPILLGSASPRRAELLRGMGIEFEVIVSTKPEIVPDQISISKYAEYLSHLKSENLRYQITNNNALLITADTVVIHDDQILNKPESNEEAKDMLASLSDSTHIVQSSITIYKNGTSITDSDIAEVRMKDLTKDEINYYTEAFNPTDKAGAYGIQEWIGMTCIQEIKGSFYTIMGLPTHLLYHLLVSNFK